MLLLCCHFYVIILKCREWQFRFWSVFNKHFDRSGTSWYKSKQEHQKETTTARQGTVPWDKSRKDLPSLFHPLFRKYRRLWSDDGSGVCGSIQGSRLGCVLGTVMWQCMDMSMPMDASMCCACTARFCNFWGWIGPFLQGIDCCRFSDIF